MKESEFRKLIERYERGQVSAKEKALLDEWFETFGKEGNTYHWPEEAEEKLKHKILVALDTVETQHAEYPLSVVEGSRSIASPAKVVSINRSWKWVAAAASIALLAVVGYGVFSYLQSDKISTNSVAQNIQPGGDKAILTLADGSQVALNTLSTSIPQQGVAHVVSQNGQLSYVPVNNMLSEVEAYNIVSTPRGGQYQVTLSDGSNVWLNAASSLKFPAAFSGTERVVELTGEAYFEIATLRQRSGEKMPFKVMTPDGSEVKVLGTHFNVMAYAEEGVMKTTLLEGSVKVSSPGGGGPANAGEGAWVRLVPNQQARITKEGKLSVIKDYDVTEAVAWKNDMFMFDAAPVSDILRQVSRWYDAEIIYEEDFSDLTFTISVPRKENVSLLLKSMELTGVIHFEIKGKQILVKRGKKQQ